MCSPTYHVFATSTHQDNLYWIIHWNFYELFPACNSDRNSQSAIPGNRQIRHGGGRIRDLHPLDYAHVGRINTGDCISREYYGNI